MGVQSSVVPPPLTPLDSHLMRGRFFHAQMRRRRGSVGLRRLDFAWRGLPSVTTRVASSNSRCVECAGWGIRPANSVHDIRWRRVGNDRKAGGKLRSGMQLRLTRRGPIDHLVPLCAALDPCRKTPKQVRLLPTVFDSVTVIR